MPLPEHQRRLVTPLAMTVRVDCSCGRFYTVSLPLGSDQYAALEHAAGVHAGTAENVSGLVHYVHDSESAGAMDKLG